MTIPEEDQEVPEILVMVVIHQAATKGKAAARKKVNLQVHHLPVVAAVQVVEDKN
jgi:hypothetical protein